MVDILLPKYNIYCDESRVENTDSQKMVIGALIIPRDQKIEIVSKIKGIFASNNFSYELKWSKTSDRYLELYKSLIDYFVSDERIGFRCIIVNKKGLDYAQFHNEDKELAFFKFYNLMLRQKLLDCKQYYIFLDKKPTRDKNRARALHSYLESYILLHRKQCSIAHLQAYNSHENILLQVADYFTGMVGYAANDHPRNTIKYGIVKYLREKLGRSKLVISTPLSEEKFNMFIWRSENAKKR
ncbi:MAG: DUF3800 domain-containing protein [Candidatus Margulisiibacteriota bacterium]